MVTKVNIAKFLIVFGFLLSIANYGIELINFYAGDIKTSIVFEETESSEKKEKESSEKEEFKEKDKISQDSDHNDASLADCNSIHYPDYYLKNTSIYLEQNTPPPEFL